MKSSITADFCAMTDLQSNVFKWLRKHDKIFKNNLLKKYKEAKSDHDHSENQVEKCVKNKHKF